MEYKRFPILLDTQTILLLQLFHRKDNVLNDLWVQNMDGYEEVSLGNYKKSAEQLLDQLEDHWTPAFLMYLRDSITDRLKEHDNKYGTKFATRLQK